MAADSPIDAFFDMLAAERGASANTLEAYRRDLGDLLAHLQLARHRTDRRDNS